MNKRNNSLINHEGVTAAIANGLTNNKKLEKLDVDRSAINQDVEVPSPDYYAAHQASMTHSNPIIHLYKLHQIGYKIG